MIRLSRRTGSRCRSIPKGLLRGLAWRAIYQRMGKTEQARAEYEAVLHVAPHSVEGNTGMGQIAFQNGHLQEATTYLERAFPGRTRADSAAGELLATTWVREGKYSEADGDSSQANRERSGQSTNSST
jgi:Flp pilus assembly protein TadD